MSTSERKKGQSASGTSLLLLPEVVIHQDYVIETFGLSVPLWRTQCVTRGVDYRQTFTWMKLILAFYVSIIQEPLAVL